MQQRSSIFSLLLCSIAMLWTMTVAAATDPKLKPAEKKDTTAGQGLEDKGFRNLFVNTPGMNAVATAPKLNTQVLPFVEDYLKKHEKHLQSMKSWAGPYFAMMDAILQSYGLPKELKYLAVIESNLQSYAQSWAGAVGPWQFMPETGRRMGLRITYRYDERTDYYKSTHAAAKYLRELHNQLGDWLLVIAAYNGGPGNVQSAIRKSGSRDFWKLQFYLPQESRNHVKKFISTHYIMEGAAGQTTSTKEEWANHQSTLAEQIAQRQTQLDPAVLNSTATTEVQGRYNSVVVANALSMDINAFNTLNPGFDALVNTEKGYTLRIPTDKMEFFKANRFNILYQSVVATMQQATNRSIQYPAIEAKPAAKKSMN